MNYSIVQIITMKCIGKCNYCMYGNKLNLIEDVPLEDLLKFYSKIIKDKDIVDNLKITGGEPLQPNNVQRTLDFVKWFKDNTNLMHYQINTNGNWPIPQEFLDDMNCTLQISCDGPKEYQEKCYGHEYYDELLKNLEIVRGRQSTHLMMVITPETKQYFEYVKQLAADYNIEFKSQYAALVDKGKEINSDFSQSIIDVPKDEYGNPISYDIRPIHCVCGKNMMGDGNSVGLCVTADGRIVNCPILSESMTTGLTIYNCSIKEVDRIKSHLRIGMSDKSCFFPEGFKETYKNLSEKNKQVIKEQTMNYEREVLSDYFDFTFE